MMKKWFLTTMLTVALSVGAVAGVFTPQLAQAASPSAADVDSALQRGDYQRAQSLLDQVVAAHPDSARAHYLDAQVLEHNGRYADALTQIKAARTADPAIGFTDRAKFDAVERRITARAQGGSNGATSGNSTRASTSVGATMGAMTGTGAAVHHGTSPMLWVVLIIVLVGVVALIMWGMRRRQAQDDSGSTDMRRAQLQQATTLMDAVRAAKLDLKLSTATEKQGWLSDAEQIEAELRGLIDRLSDSNAAASRSPEADPGYQLEALRPRVARIQALAAGRPDPMQAPVENRSAYASEAERLSGQPNYPGQPTYPGQPNYPGQPGQPQVVINQAPQSGLGGGMGGLAAGVLLGEMFGGHRDREVIVEHDRGNGGNGGNGGGIDMGHPDANNNDAFDLGNGSDGWSDSQIDAGNDASSDWDDNNT